MAQNSLQKTSLILKEKMLPRWLTVTCWFKRCQRLWLNPSIRKIPWKRKWQPIPVVLPGKSHGKRSLVGYSTWSHKDSDMTENTRKTTSKDALFSLALILLLSPEKYV